MANDSITETAQKLRYDYLHNTFDETVAHADPFVQFELWFNDAVRSEITEPNAMILATVSAHGAPSCRAVLLKEFSSEGFVFYTNYQSKKGHDIADNPKVALLFYWGELERQVRIEGVAEKVSAAQSTNYFRSRPRDAQISAVASAQSTPIAHRTELEHTIQKLGAQYANGDVPRPEHWGGYRIRPSYFEFWQGRKSRLHDRVSYVIDHGPGGAITSSVVWCKQRLAP